VQRVFLKPGGLIVTTDEVEVVTVLGSCVSVTLHAPRVGLAGMCHGILPRPRPGTRFVASQEERFQFLSEVLPHLMLVFRMRKLTKEDFHVKVFGGANIIGQTADAVAMERLSREGVGAMNVNFTKAFLEDEGVPIKACDVGGGRGRKIFFNTGSGEVLHRFLK
jgi:chemotaxis protein CheD